jgi:hypothetical protein
MQLACSKRDDMPTYTVIAQLRNFFSSSAELLFPAFTLRSSAFAGWDEMLVLFGDQNVYRDDWFFVRTYEEAAWIAPQNRDNMIRDLEDVVLLLRLFQTGELGVVSVVITSDDGESPSRLMWNRSMSPDDAHPDYEFGEEDVPAWVEFASTILPSEAWTSSWFKTARRFFTYGAATPVELYWGEADRYVNFCIALEAILVPEQDRVGIRLRRRSAALLNLTGEEQKSTDKLLKDFYDLRSTTAHGRELSNMQKEILNAGHYEFEDLFRRLVVASLQQLPKGDDEREVMVRAMYDLSAQERVDLFVQSYKSLGAEERAMALLAISGTT